ncbi:head maturation protease, ClpP-related [Afipia felis]|uniref:head maturation protease, ClpP-related n=1 Tax=Afipia felis TaxID=1035 RepID=UPI0011C01BCF|nr:head maturation protease, ClpP-related [Afipia felis]
MYSASLPSISEADSFTVPNGRAGFWPPPCPARPSIFIFIFSVRDFNMSQWFSMAKASAGGAANINIYSEIGEYGLSAKDFNESLFALGRPSQLNISISSNGGDVSQGFAIYNMLARHSAKKVVTIEGIAASMASVIAMAGDEIVMPSNSMLMIHNPWGGVVGDADEVDSFGEALRKMQDQIADVYAKRSGASKAKIVELMDAESWLTAQEAVDLGLADRVSDAVRMAALIDTGKFKNTPNSIKEMTANWKPRSWDDMRIKAFQRWNASCKAA